MSLLSTTLASLGLDNSDIDVKPTEVEDITKAVDENGNPLPDEQQEETRYQEETVNTVPDPIEMIWMNIDPVEQNGPDKESPNKELPYCPVKIFERPGEGRTYFAYLTGPILDVEDYVDLIDTLLIADKHDKYFIFIDSPGGMIASGGIIASAVHHSQAEVYTVARGICASAAALIHSAAKKERQLTGDFAVMMYHMSSHFDMGTSTKILERAKNQVRYVNECLLNKALEDGHFTEEEFARIQSGDEIFVPASEFLHRVGR